MTSKRAWEEMELDEAAEGWWKLNVMSVYRHWPTSILSPEDVAKNVNTTHDREPTKAIVRVCINALCEDGKLYRVQTDGGVTKWAYKLAREENPAATVFTPSPPSSVPPSGVRIRGGFLKCPVGNMHVRCESVTAVWAKLLGGKLGTVHDVELETSFGRKVLVVQVDGTDEPVEGKGPAVAEAIAAAVSRGEDWG